MKQDITWELKISQSDHTLHGEQDHSEPGKLHQEPALKKKRKKLDLIKNYNKTRK